MKELINIGAEDSVTANIHDIHRRTTSVAIKVFTISVNTPGPRFEFGNSLDAGSPLPRSTP